MPIFKRKNDDFFKTWSAEMAYILGYFAADGNMIRNKRGAHYIEFTSTDRELIENVRRVLKSNHRIKSKVRVVNRKRIYRIQIGSKSIFNDLMRFGFTPNKSKTLRFPKIPDAYLACFVRGYFDGDGHVSMGIYKRSGPRKNPFIRLLTTGFTCGTESFLVKLWRCLKKHAGIEGGTLAYRSRAYRLSFSINDSRKLHNFMYTGALERLYLKRKKKVFENFMGR